MVEYSPKVGLEIKFASRSPDRNSYVESLPLSSAIVDKLDVCSKPRRDRRSGAFNCSDGGCDRIISNDNNSRRITITLI